MSYACDCVEQSETREQPQVASWKAKVVICHSNKTWEEKTYQVYTPMPVETRAELRGLVEVCIEKKIKIEFPEAEHFFVASIYR